MTLYIEPGVSLQDIMDPLLCPGIEEAEGKLSDEERKVLVEVRAERQIILDQIKILQRSISETDAEISYLSEEGGDLNHEFEETAVRRRAASLFNCKAQEGLELLASDSISEMTPKIVAEFLKNERRLKKQAIGDFVGDMHEFNIATLKEFVHLHDFKGMTMVDALRDFLWSFLLPGEAQKISRIMESFAEHFASCNSDVFSCADTCYVLAYSVIMLNTSLHNPSVKDKPTPERFVSMNRGIDNGKDLPKKLLLNLYDNIKRKPFEVPDQVRLAESFFNPEREGWLTKEGGTHHTKHRRWFILKDSVLYYFKTEAAKDRDLIGSIPLEFVGVKDVPSSESAFVICSKQENQVIKAWKKSSTGSIVLGNHSRYLLIAQSAEEKVEWVRCIEKSINDTVYNGFRERKRRLARDQPALH